jgi:general secretion pathway protein G
MSYRDTGYGIQDSGEGVTVSRILYPVSSKGFTLLELIIVISVISILAAELLKRVPDYQELAEKSVVEQTAGAMQSALTMRVGSLMVHGAATTKELNALAADNPINWLQPKPSNYAGEFFDPAPDTVKPGQWMFDLKTRELIYVPDHTRYFTPGADGKKWIRFHVKLVYESPVGVSRGKKEIASTLFEPTEPYHWSTRERS